MKTLLFIGIGGFFGAVARYVLGVATQSLFQERVAGFPVGTLAVNLLGCLMIGFLARCFTGRFQVSPELQIALTVGFLGAFTTFSTYAYDIFILLEQGRYAFAAGNFLLSNGLGLLAVWVGYRLAGIL